MAQLNGKNILVTGGAGFIGSHLVDAIIKEKPKRLAVVDNLFLGKKGNLKDAFSKFKSLKFYKVNASDHNKLKKIAAENKIEILFNLAVIPLPKSLVDPEWSVKENIDITLSACKLARERCIKTLIHFSSSESYGSALKVPMAEDHPINPLTPYAASKAACDNIVLSYRETFGIDTAIIRPFNNYGPRQNEGNYAGIIPIVVNRVFSNKPIEIYGDGFQTRDFTYVKDTAEAAIRIYKEEKTRGRIINIASGKETNINDLVESILEAMQRKGHKVTHIAPRPGDVRRHCGSIELAKRLIGFVPSSDMKQGLKETVQWYEELKR